MREHFQAVLGLQRQFSPDNTPAMALRGDLIRTVIPGELREWPGAQFGAAEPFRGRLNVQGRDGTGRKTFVPWVRVHSPELSPSAQNGWYVVYLFRDDGDGVALCLSHGSTRFDGSAFVPRPQIETKKLMSWARQVVGGEAASLGLTEGVDLGSQMSLSRAYERTTVFSITYPTEAIPDDASLSNDLTSFMRLLGKIYNEEQFGEEYPVAASNIATRLREEPAQPDFAGNAQGYGLSALDRAAIEGRAMSVARQWLHEHDYTNVEDVHLTHSCDFTAFKNNEKYVVEVKGTSSSTISEIILTSNETRLHIETYPKNILITVHGILLSRFDNSASQGEATAFVGWEINPDNLKPTQYRYKLTP